MKGSNFALLVLLCILPVTLSRKKSLSRELKCAVCEAVVDEIAWSLHNKVSMDVDLRWRLKPNGERDGKTIPYRQSEVAAIEVLEEICETMKDYGQGKRGDGVQTLERINARPGQTSVTISNVSMDSKLSKQFKDECESLLGDYEDDITRSIMSGDSWDDMFDKTCTVCSELERPRKQWSVNSGLPAESAPKTDL